jgi:hypothetical protein
MANQIILSIFECLGMLGFIVFVGWLDIVVCSHHARKDARHDQPVTLD